MILVKRVRKARADAQLLYQKVKNLERLVRAVDSRLQIRDERRGSEAAPKEEARIEETSQTSLDACRQCLLNLIRIARRAAHTEHVDRSARLVRSICFTLSADTIQRQEKDIETQIQALSTSLSLLQLIEHEATQNRLDRLDRTVQQAIAHLKTIPHEQISSRTSMPDSQSSKTLVATETELIGVKSLKKTIEVARSVQSSHGSTIAPDACSLERREEDTSSDEGDSIQDDDEGYEIVDENDLAEEDYYPLEMRKREMEEFIKQAAKDFNAENYPAAERHIDYAISHAVILERHGYLTATDQTQMRK